MSEGDRWSMPDSSLWIYPDLWWAKEARRGCELGERVREEGRRWRHQGFSFFQGQILKAWRAGRLSMAGREGGGVPTQWCCSSTSDWLSFILAHGSVSHCCVVDRGERPCLHIELHYIPPRTQSCLSDRLIGICFGFRCHKGILFHFPLICLPRSLH